MRTVVIVGTGIGGMLTALELSQYAKVIMVESKYGIEANAPIQPALFHGIPLPKAKWLSESGGFCTGSGNSCSKIIMKNMIKKYPFLSKHCKKTGALYTINSLSYFKGLAQLLSTDENYSFLNRYDAIKYEVGVKCEKNMIGSVLSKGDGVINVGQLLKEITEIISNLDVEFFFGETVIGYREGTKSPIEVITSKKRIMCDSLVITSEKLSKQLSYQSFAGRKYASTYTLLGTSQFKQQNKIIINPETSRYSLPNKSTQILIAFQTLTKPQSISKKFKRRKFNQHPNGLAILDSSGSEVKKKYYTIPNLENGGKNPLVEQISKGVYINTGYGDSPGIFCWSGSKMVCDMVLDYLSVNKKINNDFSIQKHSNIYTLNQSKQSIDNKKSDELIDENIENEEEVNDNQGIDELKKNLLKHKQNILEHLKINKDKEKNTNNITSTNNVPIIKEEKEKELKETSKKIQKSLEERMKEQKRRYFLEMENTFKNEKRDFKERLKEQEYRIKEQENEIEKLLELDKKKSKDIDELKNNSKRIISEQEKIKKLKELTKKDIDELKDNNSKDFVSGKNIKKEKEPIPGTDSDSYISFVVEEKTPEQIKNEAIIAGQSLFSSIFS